VTPYITLLAAVVLQLCLGGIYAWSGLVGPMQRQLGFSGIQTQLVFGVVFAAFTLSMIFTGRLLDRTSPRPLAVAGGALLLLGYTVAARSSGGFVPVLAGVGLLGGLAIGLGYPAAIAAPARWFPARRGLVTGVVVGGYGGGAMLTTALYEWLLAQGLGVQEVLFRVGLGYGILIMVCGLLLAVPEAEGGPTTETIRRMDLLRDGRFWRLVIAFFCGNLPGLLVIGNLKPLGIALGNSPAVSAMAIVVLSVGNSGGRVLWGALFDRLGARRAVTASLLLVLGAGALMVAGGGSAPLFLAGALLTGLGFASCLVLHAAQVMRTWGAEQFGTVYGLVILAHGAGALVGPPLGGLSQDLLGSFIPGLVAALVVAAVGLALYRRT
jgi:MFS transporter, OFA family, oxalate/formate antiporter